MRAPAEHERERGIRLVVETNDPADRAAVSARVQDLLGPTAKVEPLFDRPAGRGGEELASFFAVTIPGAQADDLDENIFDWAYRLRGQAGFRSVEPVTATAAVRPPPPPGFETAPGFESSVLGTDPVPADPMWSLKSIKVPQAWTARQTAETVCWRAHLDTGWADHVTYKNRRVHLTAREVSIPTADRCS